MSAISVDDSFIEIREGLAKILAPNPKHYQDEKGYYDPAWAPVFYNPRMRASRDLSSVAIRVFSEVSSRKKLRIVDALGATGVRGIRYALENRSIVEKVIINDINKVATKIIEKNTKINGLEDVVEITNEDAIILLTRNRGFDVVDIDPFGSPAPFTEAALRAVNHGGLACYTATDLPPLVGIYPKTCIRKYFSKSIRADFSKELGLRILVYFIAREAAKIGKTAIPVFSYYMDHHYRACFQIFSTKSRHSMLPENVGYVYYCPKCLGRGIVRGITPRLPLECSFCGNKEIICGGPIWINRIWDNDFVQKMHQNYSKLMKKHNLSKKGFKILETINKELVDVKFYYQLDRLTSTYKIGHEPPLKKLISSLVSRGYAASPTHFDPKGFKTNAPLTEIVKILRSLASEPR